MGTDSVVLDCEYGASKPVGVKEGLVMKWFFNGSAGLVQQWIPPMRPQVIGLLKGKVELNFRISDEPLQAYRAIKILRPTTDLSGNYTCVVSTFMEEDRQTRPMLVYSKMPLKQAVTEITMDSWGLYTVETKAVVHDDDVTNPEEFVKSVHNDHSLRKPDYRDIN
ncbi:Uncharacterized protein OBRU01_13950 [Operophtera brumata]|uniref:Ig-like domain-containing protein n=1 Tax=Operophtera brumata TaxID=104452 RepID=A0A0L7L876_OPEBR|nr:Uncharacterized protein OBRU01_13950 [Operophtera brumata]